MKQKGFTLIELLAVIIILAVVALIATPSILDVINDAKVSARKSSLAGYADAVKLKATTEYLNNGGIYSSCIDLEYLEVNNNSVRCMEAYYTTNNQILLGSCIVEGNSGTYWYINGSVTDSKPDDFDIIKINSLTSNSCNSNDYTNETCFDFYSEEGVIIDYDVITCGLDVFIPSTISGVLVKTINNGAFAGDQLTSVTIPNSVTYIDEYAFAFNQLTNVTIPDSVTHIGDYAFGGNQLTDITIPNGVTDIGDYTFVQNDLITAIIPDSVISIGYMAFSENSLTNLIIPSSVTTIGGSAFSNNQLISVTIPNSVITIGIAAFGGNYLTEIAIPDSVEIIEQDAFCNNHLTGVTIPNSVMTIGSNAFFQNNITQGNAKIDNASGSIIVGSDAFGNNGPAGDTTITPTYLR